MVNKSAKPEIRVRFAPSPTGYFHIGTARTALFNYLFAKKYVGKFIVRIEDTDLERSDPKFEENILESLKWLGLEWDEGPVFSQKENTGMQNAKCKMQNYIGDYGPYRQSERIESYAKYIKQLLDEGKAYYCFCAEEELEARRQEMESRGVAPKYSGKCAALSKKESEKLIQDGKPSIIRFRMPNKKSSFNDLTHGKIDFDTELMGDIAIAKNLNAPLYNFAVVVDDFEMKITNVIRGGDHISNTPKQLMLCEALNFPRPEYAHLPLILGPDKAKLSKRHGSAAISDYREQGYLPEALINFLVLMGWNPGNNREIFSLAELEKEFDFARINKSPAIFNMDKLDWFNGYYIKQKSLNELTMICLTYLEKNGFVARETISETRSLAQRARSLRKISRSPSLRSGTMPAQNFMVPEIVSLAKTKFQILGTSEIVSFDWLKKVVALEQGRMKKLSEIGELTEFIFRDKIDYDKELLRWKNMSDDEIRGVLEKLEKILGDISEKNWTKEKLQEVVMPEADKLKDRGRMLWPLRAALTGRRASPGPFEVAEVLGQNKTIVRIKSAKSML